MKQNTELQFIARDSVKTRVRYKSVLLLRIGLCIYTTVAVPI